MKLIKNLWLVIRGPKHQVNDKLKTHWGNLCISGAYLCVDEVGYFYSYNKDNKSQTVLFSEDLVQFYKDNPGG